MFIHRCIVLSATDRVRYVEESLYDRTLLPV